MGSKERKSSTIPLKCVSGCFTELFLLVLDPLSSPGRWLEQIGKVLCLVGHLAIAKLHNADCLSWLLVVAEHVLGDPEIAVPNDAPDGEAQLRRVVSAKGLNVVATADSLARLRILDQDVVVIDLVLRFNVTGCRGCQCRSRAIRISWFSIVSPPDDSKVIDA
jgi:hypothetical protein